MKSAMVAKKYTNSLGEGVVMKWMYLLMFLTVSQASLATELHCMSNTGVCYTYGVTNPLSQHKEKRPIKIQYMWTRDRNSIEQDSVCRNYQYGSIRERQCLVAAKVKFQELCDRHPKGNYRYCDVARSLKIVR
jgi:hypothetical protein